MPLEHTEIEIDSDGVPPGTDAFIREANDRILLFTDIRKRNPIQRFIPSDFHLVYETLSGLAQQLPGPSKECTFCEWGSGFGVVACLAAMIGFRASGIEIEADLVHQARQLAADFCLDVPFTCGDLFDEPSDPYVERGFRPEDIDMVFAYPWPGEEARISEHFEHVASPGAYLGLYRGIEEIQVLRRT